MGHQGKGGTHWLYCHCLTEPKRAETLKCNENQRAEFGLLLVRDGRWIILFITHHPTCAEQGCSVKSRPCTSNRINLSCRRIKSYSMSKVHPMKAETYSTKSPFSFLSSETLKCVFDLLTQKTICMGVFSWFMIHTKQSL